VKKKTEKSKRRAKVRNPEKASEEGRWCMKNKKGKEKNTVTLEKRSLQPDMHLLVDIGKKPGRSDAAQKKRVPVIRNGSVSYSKKKKQNSHMWREEKKCSRGRKNTRLAAKKKKGETKRELQTPLRNKTFNPSGEEETLGKEKNGGPCRGLESCLFERRSAGGGRGKWARKTEQ